MKFKKKILLLLLVVFSVIPLSDLLRDGFPITHDGQDHIARIANFYQNLQEGIIIPRWARNLNWGYGHPILMFLYPFPSYFASLFYFVGFGLIESYKLVFGLSYILSGITMYVFLKSFINDKSAFIGSVLYLYAPYRFVDFYVRGAIGEHVAFIFPPIVFYCLFKLHKKVAWSSILVGSLSLGGLILSHNAISIMFFPLIVLYGSYLYYFSTGKKKFLFSSLMVIVLGLCFTSFFWTPAFFEGKYTLRDIVTAKEYMSGFVEVSRFFSLDWSYGGSEQLSVQIGIVQWIFVLLSLVLIYKLIKEKNKLGVLLLIFFTTFFLSLFLMTSLSGFIWQKITTLHKFQFPWRFMSLTVYSTAILGGIVFSLTSKKFQNILLITILFILIISNKNYWHAKDFDLRQTDFFTKVYEGTTDTGESAPIWSVRFMEKRPKTEVEIISGEAIVQKIKRSSTIHTYKVKALKKSQIRENTLYFPGWTVLIDGIKTPVEFQDPQNRGLMTFFVEKGTHMISIEFRETKLRLIANIISGASIGIAIFYSLIRYTYIWKRFL